MGMSVTGGDNQSRQRTSQDQWQNSSQNNNSNTNSNFASSNNQTGQTGTDATFNSAQGQQILSALTQMITGANNGNNYSNAAGAAFNRAAEGGINPAVESIISSGNKAADVDYANRAAAVRSQGYRGGDAASIVGQSRLNNEFTNNQAGQNANLRYGAFNDAANRQLSAAGGLAGLGTSMTGQQQGLGSQILALLRGQSTSTSQSSDSVAQQQSQTIENIIRALTGGTSGTTSNVGRFGQFTGSWGAAGGGGGG